MRQANIWKFIMLSVGLLSIVIGGCREDRTMFVKLPSSQTGISFNNTITEYDSLNAVNFEYIYNGGGVGIGDFNNDGLQDVFFSGNQVKSKLYLNKGEFNFTDITVEAGIAIPYWCTGVALVDINQDGLLDIYVSTATPVRNDSVPNQLFINQGLNDKGIPVFKEMGRDLGLADFGYSTQAVFFDYDKDGDLDCYVLNNALEQFDRNIAKGQFINSEGKSTDKLYKNIGPSPDKPLFTDVSKEAGITIEGWGLGIGIADFNDDGWLDVYCANDFLSNDLLWINNGDGTFTNKIAEYLKHQTTNSMGMDISDINNDGLVDIVVVDMMPEDNLRQKMMFSKSNADRYKLNIERGYQPQFIRNTLQLNRGLDQNRRAHFSEIGYLSGIYATDWSWSPLVADFDNDGFNDLLITNGYKKDVTNLDFISYGAHELMFGSSNSKGRIGESLKKLESLLGVKKSNFCFRNEGELNFENVTQEWGLEFPSYSNGAAYADLDNDGDLDLIINNIDDEAFIFENTLNYRQENTANYIKLILKGEHGNISGIGATVRAYVKGKLFYVQHSPYRGYKSTVDKRLHIGLGKENTIDSLVVRWQSGKEESIYNTKANQTLTLYEKDADFKAPNLYKPHKIFNETSSKRKLEFLHSEKDFSDFNIQPLLHHKNSQYGPSMAVGDLDGDGLEDLWVGGAAGMPASVFFQNNEGGFSRKSMAEKPSEDLGVLLFDADGDGDLDVYCVSGSVEFRKDHGLYEDRLYLNDGNGNLTLNTGALPHIESSGSCVVANDFDKDGDLDLFVGGRIVPGKYPLPPQSSLLINDGSGKFTDAIDTFAEGLREVGMVTSALWTDFDNDGWTDLIVVGEFMPITFFKNEGGKLLKYYPEYFDASGSSGWWNSIVGGDLDNDGDIDYVLGNLGKNSLFQASKEQPVCLYYGDFDENGKIDPILCHYIEGKEYPAAYREDLTTQITSLKRSLTSYQKLGSMTYSEIFSSFRTAKPDTLKATNFASVIMENQGNGSFRMIELPIEAQFSSIYGIIIEDVDNDSFLDIIATGNDYAYENLSGRQDASLGVVLLNSGHLSFHYLPMNKSGFLVDGDAKAAVKMYAHDDKTLFVFSQNNDSIRVFERIDEIKSDYIKLSQNDQFAELDLGNGKRRKVEFYFGSGYLSQSSRLLEIPHRTESVKIFDTKGNSKELKLN